MCTKSEREGTIRALRQELERLRKEQVDFHLLQQTVEREADTCDVGTQTTLRRHDLTLALRAQERHETSICRIRHALQRFAGGWDGTCVSCGNDIPAQRLVASPGTTHCVECKRVQEDHAKNTYGAHRY